MFVTRLISGIILVALALLFICTGGDVLLAVMLVLSLVGMFELYRIFKVEKRLPGIFGYIGCIAYYLNLKFHYSEDVMVIMLALLIALLGVFVFAYPKYGRYLRSCSAATRPRSVNGNWNRRWSAPSGCAPIY